MIQADGADSRFETSVEYGKASVAGAGLINQIVAHDPRVRSVMRCNMGPEPDSVALVVFEVPEGGIVAWIGRVRIRILPTRTGVRIQNGINFVFSTL